MDGPAPAPNVPEPTRSEPTRSTVVKVGGSLFSLPDLSRRLERFLDDTRLVRPLFLAGGGASARYVKSLQDLGLIGEEQAHWLAIHALGFQANILASILPGSQIIDQLDSARKPGLAPRPILDPVPWLTRDGGAIVPVGWHVTSDSIAALLARELARDLILLKSIGSESVAIDEAARRGWVDPYFSEAAVGVTVGWVNLRGDQLSGSR